jgi:hypothetical protein
LDALSRAAPLSRRGDAKEHVMRSVVVLGAVAVVAATIAGCSSADTSDQGTLAVQGTVTQALVMSGARAVAIGTDGRTFWTDLDAQRDFTLRLPVGQSYRIVIANALAGGADEKIAHLVLQASWGPSMWLGANEPGTVDLGVLKLTTQQGDDDDHEGDHDHDNGCHEGGHHHHGGGGDGDGDGVCKGDHDDPLQPSKSPGSKCDDHDHHGHHHDAGTDGSDHDHDGDGDGDGDGDDQPCPKADAGPPKGDAGAKVDAGVDTGSSGGVGADCLSNKDCASPLTCKAGLCSL